MIELKVEEYCQNCPYFEPEVEKGIPLLGRNEEYIGQHDTTISCSNRYLCAVVERHYKDKEWDKNKGEKK